MNRFELPSSVNLQASDAVRQRRRILVILILATAFSDLDRQILGMLLEPIRVEFQLSDTELGLLSGLAFTTLYAALAVPLAVLADRISRRGVISLSLATFSGMTALCGMAPGFIYLLLFRMGVAAGEAGMLPASQALIADHFPKNQLTSAMSKLYISGSVGGIIAFMLGGFLSGAIGWRLTYIVIGIPGILVAIASYLFLPKAKAYMLASATGETPTRPRFRATLDFLWSQRAYRRLLLANGVWSFAGAGVALWAAPFISRTYQLSPAQIGLVLAVVISLAGAIGLFVVGHLAEKMSHKDPRWMLWTVAIALLLATPLGWVTFLNESGAIAMATGCAVAFLAVSSQGAIASVVQFLVPPSMRSVAAAVKHLLVTALGAGLGPLIVGVISDHLAARFGNEAIRYSLAAASTFWALSGLLFIYASRTFVEDVRRAEAPDLELK
ncbi:MFS transporter [Sphingopyxis sp. GW247-27LB]|uniref:spinster family MFS transporter n=1 Tax=Sphingopyxis sp. GW247-27LB TaxID=2012632 RepID=UPI000BA7277F|nr:MFS transporter [Sphingopyxis sp. GW247-27LB]PAL21510.1 hypothetical protein CD928_14125 [Sphingopyxis sp. GW247-27LB]